MTLEIKITKERIEVLDVAIRWYERQLTPRIVWDCFDKARDGRATPNFIGDYQDYLIFFKVKYCWSLVEAFRDKSKTGVLNE